MTTYTPTKHTDAKGPARPEIAHDLHEIGVCAVCGSFIAAERLRLLRWATSCAGCAEQRHP